MVEEEEVAAEEATTRIATGGEIIATVWTTDTTTRNAGIIVAMGAGGITMGDLIGPMPGTTMVVYRMEAILGIRTTGTRSIREATSLGQVSARNRILCSSRFRR